MMQAESHRRMHGSESLSFCFRIIFVIFVSVSCLPVKAQQADQRRVPANDLVVRRQQVGQSELEKENLGYVAASAVEIQGVLAKDVGLLVELKRYVAKEASDRGQVVSESDLSNQAIFDRLNQDVQFRSVATRLLQRYGYLVPSPNPDSTLAKQEELILKERARHLVQVEGQEDAAALQKSKREEDDEIEQTSTCDPRRDKDCPTERARSPRSNSDSPDMQQAPTSPRPTPEQQLQTRPDQMIRTTSTPLDGGQINGLDLQLRNWGTASKSEKRFPSGISDGLPLDIDRSSLLSELHRTGMNPAESSNVANSGISKVEPQRKTRTRTDRNGFVEEAFAPVSLVHQATPFADIPSMYDMYVQAASHQKPERFGLEVFSNSSRLADVMPMDLPVGPEYVVGPGDGLAIDVWGGISQRMVRVVDREGRITLPEAGPLLVSGRSLGEVQEAVQRVMRTEFRDVSADVSLSRLRTVRIYVVGDVAEPGAYDISSLSTPLNAIFAAGGVTPRGSLRGLKHYHGKQLVQEVDAYDLLLRGVQSDLLHLENGDTLMVPPLGPQVTVDGMVRRPAIYELHGERSLAEVVTLAGGILPAATLSHIEVQRLEAHQKRSMVSLTIASTESPDSVIKKLQEFEIVDGDEVHIFPIAPYNEDAIYLQGHVIRPGRYSYKAEMKFTDLIGSYNDLLPVPAAHYAEIIRLNPPDSHPSVESFDLAAALANPEAAPKLKPLDTVRIYSKYDFEPAPAIWVGGEVRAPGKYNTSGEAHLRDAVFLAGGMTPDASLGSAQLFRTQADGTMKILSVNLTEALAGDPINNIILQPRDRLLIQRSSARLDPATVYIKGEVAKPGRYPLTTNMHVEDLVQVAGGLKRSAYTESADLMRYPETAQGQISSEFVTVNLGEAIGGEAKANLPLRDGDVLTIKPIAGWSDIGASVTLRGELQHPGTYGIRPGERLSTALERAGGFTAEAYPYGAVLMRREVRDLEIKAHNEMIERVKAERVQLKALPEADADQKNAKLTALARTDATLNQLVTSEPIGRVVIHVQPGTKEWKDTAADVTLRDGDVLVVPKKENYVMVNGQVFNPTAISYRSGLSAKWYLSQAGGLTPLADKKAVFVIRADGSVISAKNNGSGWWMGDPMNTTLRAGDTVVVPEKAIKVGGPNWAQIMQAAQLASSVALAVAYIHP